MGPPSWGLPLIGALLLLVATSLGNDLSLRVKRQVSGAQSLLTVEWEGIQTGDHPDSDVQGFLVEYRAENENQWNVHSGIIPYKGPNHQYRVQIPRLPMGMSFFVRIKVLGVDGSVLVETPEIRARNEMVSIKCDGDYVSEPRNVEITQAGRFSLAVRWDVPECGSIGDYQVEVTGMGNSSFDVHRQTVVQPYVSITNLLPGTFYSIKVRASDRSRTTGPWSQEILEAQTKGEPVPQSNVIHIDYRTDSQIRVTWQHFDDERVQHYEVMAVEVDSDSRRVERARISPQQSSHILSGLKPNTEYLIGVIAFVDHEPKQTYRVSASTARRQAAPWRERPQVIDEGDGMATVHWTVPPVTDSAVSKFIVEYRLPNENQWRRGDERAFDGSVGDYSVSLSDLVDVPFYAVRVVAVDEQNTALSITEEVTVGQAAEGACLGRSGIPRDIHVEGVEVGTLKISWKKPECDETVAPIDGYEYILYDSSISSPPDGASYVGATQVSISDLKPNAKYMFKVRSRSGNGHSAWSAPLEITTSVISGGSQAGHPVSGGNGVDVQIEQPRVEQQGARTTLFWTVSGKTDDVVAYQPEIRTQSDQWRSAGGVVDSEVSQKHFRQPMGALPAAFYYARVRAVDSNGRTVATSPSASFQVQCQAPLSPENIRLDRVSDNLVRLSWSAPEEDASCGGVFYITGLLNGQQVNYRVASTERSYDIQAGSSSTISLEVRAANKAGSGAASQQAMLSNAHQSLVSTPRVSTRGNELLVSWRSEGDGQGVFGYRVQFRTDQSGWNPYGQIIPYVGDNQEYQQVLTGLQLGHTYNVHIQVLDRNSYVMYTSPESTATSECRAPSHPPSHLQVIAPDPSHVRVQWAHPPQSTWGCADLQFEIQAEEPHGQQPITVAGSQTTHIFQSRPNEKWAVKIRAKNSAGHSAWTPASSIRTPAAGELIIGPVIQYRQGSPIVSWQSKGGTEEGQISSYVVEWKTTRDENWRQHQNQIPFSGSQRGYQLDLSGLPKGHSYQCRVVAKGPRGETVFTSPEVHLQTEQACQKPRRAPSGLTVQPVGPTQIKLTWTPLPEQEWNCDRLWYIVKYSTPRNSGLKNLTQGENFVLFESDPYTQWSFEVQAANPAGESAWSRAETAQTQAAAPGPVSDFRIQPMGPDAIQISWRQPINPNGQITSYEITYQLINRGMCEEVREAARTEQTLGPHFVLRNLHPHSKYRIGVAARTTIAGERVSQEVHTDQAPPSAAPNYLRVDGARADSASISWQAPSCLQTNGEITEYEYEVTPADRRTHVQKSANNVRGTRAEIPNLQPNTRYNVKVRAYTTRGPGPWTQEVPFQTTGQQIVEPPPYVGVVPGADNAQVIWQQPPSNSNINRYKCQYRSQKTSEPPREKVFPAQSACDMELLRRQPLPQPPNQYRCGYIDNLRTNETYDFKICSGTTDNRWGKCSQPATARISKEPVQVLSVVKTGGNDRSLDIRWVVAPEDMPRVTGFRLTVEAEDRSSLPMTFSVDARTFTYRIDNLRPRTSYRVTVQACTSREDCCQGKMERMTTDAAALTALTVAPRIIVEEVTSITIEWNTNTRDANGFIVEYRIENGPWQQHPRIIPAHPSQTTYTATVDGLPTNSAIELRVRVKSMQNEQSPPSPEVRGRTKCRPPSSAPQGISVDAPSPNEVRVNWARLLRDQWGCDHVNYEISYSVAGGPDQVIPLPGDQTERVLPAEPNQRWAIKLRAVNKVGASDWSKTHYITTQQGTPGAVRDLRVKALSPVDVHVSWLSPHVQRGSITGYNIKYRLKHRLACPDEVPLDASTDFITVYRHKQNEYVIPGLLPFSLYEVHVTAVTEAGAGPTETKEVSTLQEAPSGHPIDLVNTDVLERMLSFQWEPVVCSQRHGHLTNYEYEIIGLDDWAKLERQIANTSETRVTIEGLTPYTKYVMRVKAFNSVGGGPNTEKLDVMTARADAPLPPQDLTVNQEGTDFFMVSWLPPYPPYGPHDAYKLQHKLVDSEEWETVEHDVKSPLLQCQSDNPRFCFNVTGKEPGQRYHVRVSCRIEGRNYGPWSKTIEARTLQVLPDAPRAIHLIEKTDHSLHIRWLPPIDPKGHVTQYRVSIVSLDNPNDKKRTFMVDHPTLTYLFDQLEPETNYNISIAAGTKRGFGPEIFTSYATDPFHIPTVIEAPLVTPDGANSLDIQWNGVHDAKNRLKGYIIEIRNAETPAWTEIGGITDHDAVKRTYLKKVNGLDPDTLYFVRIKVVDQQLRVSNASPEGKGRTGCAAPTSPPVNVAIAAPTNQQVRFSWQAPLKGSWQCSNIKYRVEYVNGTNGRHDVEVPSSETNRLFESPANTLWTVRIRVENEAGHSEWSKELEITTGEGAPGPVTDLTAKPDGPTTAIVTWKEPDQTNGVITGYTLIYRLTSIKECGPRSSNPIEKHVRSEEQVLEDLLPDSTYEVQVIAHTSLAGPTSKKVTVTTEEKESSGAPLNVRISSVTATRADATWQQPECEKRHGKITDYMYELEAVDEWAENNTGGTRSERITFDKLTPYTEYRFRVQAQNSQGAGPFSEWVTFTTQPAAPPAPTDLQEEATFPHAIEISFVAPSPPHGKLDQYKIRYTPGGQTNYKEIRVPFDRLECSDASKRDRLCFRLKDLEPEQDYEIQVAAHTENGGWSEWSETLSSKTHEQNIPVLERELEVVETKPTTITLKWEGLPQEQSAHVVGYVLEYKAEDDSEWQEYNGVTRHRQRQNEYKITVKELTPATNYFFRLKVVGKNDKRGSPGPETKAMTSCGKPEQPPKNVKLEPIDFETLRIKWDSPPEDSWLCDEVAFIIDYVNTTGKGQLTVDSGLNELIVPTMPGTKWEVKMRTQTTGEKPLVSPWSDRVTLTTQSLPGEIFVQVEPKSPTEAQVTWELHEKDQAWNYGVDITYRLKQLGGCNEQATGSHEPITKLDVHDKVIMLSDLQPGSTYEVIVTPKRPPSLASSIVTPKTVRTFKTESDVPTGAPRNLQNTVRKDTSLGFKWDAPECIHQNGNVTQYEFMIVGLDEWNEGTREGVTPRLNTVIDQLKPGSLYQMKVRAYTSKGSGPWSETLEIRTTGSELGPPRELAAIQTFATKIQLTWLPPYPERAVVTKYRVRYSPRTDDSNPTEVELPVEELSCSTYKSPIITTDNLCTTILDLEPATTYRFAVQGQSASGNWGDWSSDYFSTTRITDDTPIGGSIKLLSATHDSLKVKWQAPAVIGDKIDKYEVSISVASDLDENPQKFTVSGQQTDYHFRSLDKVTQYNITVQGFSNDKRLWFISQVFSTTDFVTEELSWLTAPTDLRLIEKSETMLHATWDPPDIFEPEKRDLITHYRVTIAPVDPHSGTAGAPKNYTVLVPGNSIKFEDLTPATIYNITVQAATNSGYGQIMWGAFSTLAPGQRHILRLQNRTPTTLTLEWDPVWGTNHRGYTLSCRTVTSVYGHVRRHEVKSHSLDSTETQFTIKGLNPSTTYNCTLQPKDHAEGAWGAYSTLPPGWFLVKNLKQCDKTDFAVSMSWEPIVDRMGTHYQVRYLRIKENDGIWQEEAEREAKELLCPKDGCGRLCYLVFNLPHKPDEYVFQVRAMVDGQWNHWKSAGRLVISEPPHIKASCCIVPPPYFVENIGAPGTFLEIDVNPAQTDRNITRYHVVVDERDPPGDTNWTELTDKVTANRRKLPYYVAASFNLETLPEPRRVRIGDGQVIGGYLNYPLIKGKKYNYEIYTLWNISGDPLVGRLRATPYLSAGWPWWWLLALLLALLLLILLCCCLLWCLQRRYRTRKEHSRTVTNGQLEPLIKENKTAMEANLRSLEDRLEKMRGHVNASAAKGEFEDGYVHGFRDANKLGSASAARRRLDEDYASTGGRFHEGYMKGLRDGGMTGMTTSMHNLAQKGTGGGYSAGFMQGYRDGNSGVFGDRVTPSLISRLDEQYPGQDDFKQGFVDGFNEGCKSRGTDKRSFEDSRRLQQSLTELTERLTSLEKTKGDEIHSTKIYHVYNQQPEFAGYSSTGAQLAHELEEIGSRSRTSTLRRHYTPGDYLKYASEGEGYGSLGRNRRSLSASALARESSETRQESRSVERQRYTSGTLGSSYITRAGASADRQGTDTFARRYNYRSRSDVGSPRRYASQTLLDASRPGPSTPHARRDALFTLQRELDTLSRSPGGYASDSGAAHYDTVRSKARGYSNYDYDTFRSSRQEVQTSAAQQSQSSTSQQQQGAATTAVRYPVGGPTVTSTATTTIHPTVISTATHQIQSANDDAGRWADDLIGIVNEPMDKTLDRMRKYSSSTANVDAGPSTSGAGGEVIEEKYHRSYKEEHSSGGR